MKKFQPVKPSHRGLFTKKAKEHGMSVPEFKQYVLSHKDKFDKVTIAEANFINDSKDWNHK